MLAEVAVRMHLIILQKSLAQSVPGKDVNTHRCKVALGIFRFFLKFVDLVLCLGVHDTETACFFHRYFQNGDCCGRAPVLMELEHRRVVHFVDMVAGKNQNIFWVVAVDKINVLINRVCCTHEPFARIPAFYMGSQNCHAAVPSVQIPGDTDTDMLVQPQRLVLCQHADCIHAGIDAVAQRKVYDTVTPAISYSRLCHFPRQNAKPATLSSR